MRSRVFRNFTDAAITKRELLEKGVRLISAKEEFGDGYMADAMEAITDVMNEVQVRMNGEDVRVKMAHKVEQGGSIGRAKLGYLNVRKEFSGRLVNTIDIDPDRAPLVRWAFEQYATGRHSVAQLTDMLTDQGLTMRPSPSRPARPINKSSLAKILRDPYYTGIIRYKGRLYTGRHEPIVTKELFVKVQTILNSRNRDGDRDMKHFHYLRGHLVCGACHAAGRLSRLVYSQNTGNGGTYEYYTCAARNRVGCPTTGFRIEDIEDEIAKKLKLIRIDAEAIAKLRQLLRTTLQSLIDADADAKSALQRELDDLEAQEERLVELAADGTIATPKLRERLEQVALRKGVIAEKLEQSAERMSYGAETALAYLELLRDPAELFRNAKDDIRRELLAVFYTRTRVYRAPEGVMLDVELTEVNEVFQSLGNAVLAASSADEKAPRNSAGSLSLNSENSVLSFLGLNKDTLAGVPGLEPRTTEPESVPGGSADIAFP